MPGLKQVFIQALTEISTEVAKDTLGDIRWEGNKCYKYVQYDEAAAAVTGVAGEVAYYILDTGYGANNVSSDFSACGADATCIGAGVLQASLDDEDFGWIQIKGIATLSIAIIAGVDGNALTPSGVGANDGSLDVVVTTVALGHICAFITDKDQKEIMCDFPF